MSEEENKSFIEQLKIYNSNLKQNVYVPSLERTVKFNTLTAKHQKDIIHAALDNPLLNLVFHDKVYGILKELCEEGDFVDSFNIVDKNAILIQLRYLFVSKEYEEKDLTPVIEYIKTIQMDLKPKISEEDGLAIQFQIPTISQERRILKDFAKTHKHAISPPVEEDIRELISDAYILEIVKHISKVQLMSNGFIVDFNTQSYDDNVKVVELLKKQDCNKIHDFINDYKEKYKNLYFIDDNTEIEISSSIFS